MRCYATTARLNRSRITSRRHRSPVARPLCLWQCISLARRHGSIDSSGFALRFCRGRSSLLQSSFSARSSDKRPSKSCSLRPGRSTDGAMSLPLLKALLSLFPFKFLPSNAYEPFVNRVPQLVWLLLVQFFDFLFLNPICPLVSEAIEHDLSGNDCAMPHGFGQLPVEFRTSAVGVSPTCTPAIDASGFN
jgi:hypothetical protein